MTAATRFSVCCLLGIGILAAQERQGKQCAAVPEVAVAFEELDALRDSVPFSQRIQQEREALEVLRRKHSGDIWLHRRYVNLIRNEFADEWPGLRRSYIDAAAADPENVVRAYLAGWVLEGIDTPKTIAQLERAKELDPELAFPYITLTTNYSRGAWADSDEARENIVEYFRLCPDTSYSYAHSMLARTAPQDAQREVAKNLRGRLERSTDPKKLRLFEHVWSLEFRSTPPPEHGALREQIAKDLERLENLDVDPDPEWLSLLANGYKQTNANSEDVANIENRLLAEFPRSQQAFRLRIDREREAYPAPGRDATAEDWDEWSAASLARREEWIERYGPDPLLLQIMFSNYEVLETLTPEQIQHVKKQIVEPVVERFGPRAILLGRFAQFYLDHDVDLQQAVEWAEQAHESYKQSMAGRLQADYLSESERETLEQRTQREILRNLALRLEAYRRVGEQAARALREEIPSEETGRPEDDIPVWVVRAKLAEIEGRKADALTYYQHALNIRTKEPPKRLGRVDDRLLADAKRLWDELGGTEEAWDTWRRTSNAPRELVEGRWEEPNKPLNPFELSDLGGRTWKLQALEGKTVFLNLWATWCGPCQAELPYVQTLHEKLKDQPQFEVLTLNMDQELGLVQPYIDEKEFTFPVLPAYVYVNSVVDSLGIGIPQNWIIDGKGIWRWQQIGYDPNTKDWVGDMIRKLDAAAEQ